MRLVHAADIHLDSPLRTLTDKFDDDDLVRMLRQATRRALENLVELTVAEGADALLLAGDIYDGDWQDYATGRFFVEQMRRLDDAGIRVFMISGNHDAASEITRTLTLPRNVTALGSARPETVTDDDLGLAVHGQSYASRDIQENLVLAYPRPIRGLVNVGLLHTAADGAEGHAPYAPCTADDLTRVGYEYFALGHVHSHRIVCDGEHVAAFSGNLQGRHSRETGPKGALVVDVEPGRPALVRHVPCDVARWAALTVDVTACDSVEDVLERAEARLRAARDEAGDRPVVARVTFTGRSRAAADLADEERMHSDLRVAAGRLRVALEKVRSRVASTAPPTAVDPELMDAVRAACEEVAGRADELPSFIGSLKALNKEVGRLLQDAGLLDLESTDTLADLARRAGEGLVARLAGEDG